MRLYDNAPIGTPSLEDFPLGARAELWNPRQWKKRYFYEFLQGDVFRAIEAHIQRSAMKVISRHDIAHRSRDESSNVRDGEWQGQ